MIVYQPPLSQAFEDFPSTNSQQKFVLQLVLSTYEFVLLSFFSPVELASFRSILKLKATYLFDNQKMG
jgi:hypothetical protein